LIDHDADDDVLVAAVGAADADAVAFAHRAVRLGVLAVHRDLAALTPALGLGACLEETRDVQPDVQTKCVVHPSIFSLLGSCSRSRSNRAPNLNRNRAVKTRSVND